VIATETGARWYGKVSVSVVDSNDGLMRASDGVVYESNEVIVEANGIEPSGGMLVTSQAHECACEDSTTLRWWLLAGKYSFSTVKAHASPDV
jgi:hypothetical protein